MGVARLTVSDWSRTPRDTVVLNPAWSEVETAIRALNGRNLNDVYLRPLHDVDTTFLGVGGGAGRLLVTGAINGETFPTLTDAESTDETLVSLVVGGQSGDYPARWLVDTEVAVAAARAFYVHGGFDCGVPWEYPQG